MYILDDANVQSDTLPTLGASLYDKHSGTPAAKEKKQQWQEALHLSDYPDVLASIARTCAQSGLFER